MGGGGGGGGVVLRGGQYGEGKGAPKGGGGGGYSLCSWGTDCWGVGIEPSWFMEPSWPRCSMLELLIMPYFDIRSRGEPGRGGGGGGGVCGGGGYEG